MLTSGRGLSQFLNLITCFMIPNILMKGKSWISKNYETGISYQIDLNDSLCAMTLVRVVPMLNGIVSNTDFHSIRM